MIPVKIVTAGQGFTVPMRSPGKRHIQTVHCVATTFNLTSFSVWEIPRISLKCTKHTGIEQHVQNYSTAMSYRAKAEALVVRDRTVSVRPCRQRRVMAASQVKASFPAFFKQVTCSAIWMKASGLTWTLHNTVSLFSQLQASLMWHTQNVERSKKKRK